VHALSSVEQRGDASHADQIFSIVEPAFLLRKFDSDKKDASLNNINILYRHVLRDTISAKRLFQNAEQFYE